MSRPQQPFFAYSASRSRASRDVGRCALALFFAVTATACTTPVGDSAPCSQAYSICTPATAPSLLPTIQPGDRLLIDGVAAPEGHLGQLAPNPGGGAENSADYHASSPIGASAPLYEVTLHIVSRESTFPEPFTHRDLAPEASIEVSFETASGTPWQSGHLDIIPPGTNQWTDGPLSGALVSFYDSGETLLTSAGFFESDMPFSGNSKHHVRFEFNFADTPQQVK